LLVTFIPCFVDDDGAVWIDRLWHHDLLAHVPYLPQLVLCAPEQPRGDAPNEGRDLVKLDVPIARVALPPMRSTREALVNAPRIARALWRAVGESEVVHSGIAGWPLPIGWIANPIALVRGRFLLLNIESAPWRLQSSERAALKKRARAEVTELLARFFTRRADLVVVTHDGYARDFGGGRRPGAEPRVIPASWIRNDDVLSVDDALASWHDKRGGVLRALFVGRLVDDKGVRVLLDALPHLERPGTGVELVCLGEGPLADELVRHGVRVLPPVPYGEPFFRVVRTAHVVVVPTLSDEQPRVLFDAASQAVSCVASDTPGNRTFIDVDDVVSENGALVARGDARALAEALVRTPRAVWQRRGLRAVRDAREHTHEAMHDKRRVLLHEVLSAR
jgi:glycosyltransferase involved in cell wall biosynthesis